MPGPDADDIGDLIEDLTSDDSDDRLWAAEHLSRDVGAAAVEPLIQALSALTPHDLRADIEFSLAIIESLADLQDARAVPVILAALQQSPGDDRIPASACRALVELKVVDVVPALQQLREDPDWSYHADDLTTAIADLLGAGAGPYLENL